MSTRNTVNNPPAQPSVATVADLWNAAGSPNTAPELQVGDTCFVAGTINALYVCTSAGVGTATWILGGNPTFAALDTVSTASATLTSAHETAITYAGGTCALTLPADTNVWPVGVTKRVRKQNTGTNTITLAPNAGGTVNGLGVGVAITLPNSALVSATTTTDMWWDITRADTSTWTVAGGAPAAVATTTAAGLMSAADKSALDAMPAIARAPATVACLGDSISAYSSTVDDVSTPKTRVYHSTSYQTWANILLGQRLWFEHAFNFGVSGETSEEIAARVGQVVASGANICIVLAGTNDAWAQWPASRTIAALESIYAALRAAGVLVVAVPIPPRSFWSALTAGQITSQRLITYAVNRWIRRYATQTPGVVLADPTGALTDPASATADPLAGVLADGLHPSVAGGYRIGSAIAGALSEIVPPMAPMVAAHNMDAFNATLNPEGNLISNGAMRGTAGSKSAEFTGSVADGWQAARNGGTYGSGTCSCSKVARTDGVEGEWQELSFSGFTGGGYTPYVLRIECAGSGGKYVAGDTVEAECEIIVSGASFINSVSLIVQEYDNTTRIAYAANGSSSSGYYIPAAFSGVLRTPPLTIANAVTATSKIRLDIEIRLAGDLGAAGVIRVGRVDVRKVI